ncbi:hypothetical protein [Hahella chejuensis]|uniref:hypothetical protein n=1 Tax=Hahella chejuensis TaxID=158327 RepID=UPI0002F7127B|nr:hypothetical protein [Hahella chejuensis]
MARDILDQAAELQEKLNAQALARQRAGSTLGQPSRAVCIDCEDAIPPLRQQLGGVSRCVECEDYYQHAQRLIRQRGRG